MRNIEAIEKRLHHLKEVARQRGVKLTHQRLEIFRAIVSTDSHPSADMIFRTVKKRMPTVSLDTVYRTLWMLHDLGLVTTVGPERESVRFDANLGQHHHYVCVSCGLVRDFESHELNALRIPVGVSALGTIVNTQVEVRGLCVSCQSKQKPKTLKKE
jgi:Fur family peroxide stress response transcriptional regulator